MERVISLAHSHVAHLCCWAASDKTQHSRVASEWWVRQSTDSWTVSVSPTLACIGTTSTAYKTLHGKSWLQSFSFSRVGAGAGAEKLRFKCLLVVAAVSFKADTPASYLFFVVKYMFFKIRVLVSFNCDFSHFRQYAIRTADSYYQYSPLSRQALVVTNTTYVRVHSWDDHSFLNELLGTTSTLGGLLYLVTGFPTLGLGTVRFLTW